MYACLLTYLKEAFQVVVTSFSRILMLLEFIPSSPQFVIFCMKPFTLQVILTTFSSSEVSELNMLDNAGNKIHSLNNPTLSKIFRHVEIFVIICSNFYYLIVFIYRLSVLYVSLSSEVMSRHLVMINQYISYSSSYILISSPYLKKGFIL